MEIQFLRFSTGQPHDLAHGVTYGLELNCKSPSDCEIAIEAMGPYLVMIITYKARLRLSGRHQRIYFVEWTEGRMRCVSLHPVSPKRMFIVLAGSACPGRHLLSRGCLCIQGPCRPGA